VAACPAAGALDLTCGRRAVRPWVVALVLAVVCAGVVGYARLAGRWHTTLPEPVLFHLVPRAAQFGHP
jgi:hypothetical protein